MADDDVGLTRAEAAGMDKVRINLLVSWTLFNLASLTLLFCSTSKRSLITW